MPQGGRRMLKPKLVRFFLEEPEKHRGIHWQPVMCDETSTGHAYLIFLPDPMGEEVE